MGVRFFLGTRQPDDLRFGIGRGVVDVHVHQKAVHLRFGQRISTFLLDRVLRGHDQEQPFQRVRIAAHGDLPLLHGFEQR